MCGKAGFRGTDYKGGLKDLAEQDLASPWDIIANNSTQFVVAMAGIH